MPAELSLGRLETAVEQRPAPLKLLLLSLNFYPEEISTGKYSTELAQHLAASGVDVRVIAAPPYYPEWRVWSRYKWWQYSVERLGEVEVFRCPLWVPRRVNAPTRLLHLCSFAASTAPAFARQLRWRPDWVFVVVPTILAAPAALTLATLAGARSWLHVQDFELDAAVGLKLLGGGLTYRVGQSVERMLVRRFHRVSTISERMRDRLLRAGIPWERTCLLPNWVDTDEIHPLERSKAVRARLGLPADRVVALYAGNMGRKQGLEIVVEAARLLRDSAAVQFVLCGNGIERSRLEQACRELPNVRFLPLQPRAQLNALLNAADIHLLPQEGGAADFVMPSKLTGMLASGRPVVTTAAAGTELARVVGQTGLVVPPGDSSAFAAAIQRLAARPQERLAWGKRGRSYALTYLSRTAILDRLVSDLRDGHPPGR